MRVTCGALSLLSSGSGVIVLSRTVTLRRVEWELRQHHPPSVPQSSGVGDAGRAGAGASPSLRPECQGFVVPRGLKQSPAALG